MRYADLEAHQDLGLGAEELGTRRFTRPSEHVDLLTGAGAGNKADARKLAGADLIRTEALASLERRIAHNWRVWEGLSEGRSRDQLAAFVHSLEDRADQLTEDLRASRSGREKAPGSVAADSEGEVPTPVKEEN